MSDEIPEFGNYVKDKTLDGDKVRIDEILNRVIIVTGFLMSTSKYKDKGCGYCTKVQFYELSDESKKRKVFFSGSGVIKDQCEEIKGKLEEQGLPIVFKATVKKEGNYYKFV